MFWLIKVAIFGLIAGAIARMVHPGRDPMNWFWTMLLGIGGAVLGGWLGMMLGINTDAGLTGWIAAIGGAILLLALYHWATAYRPAAGGPATSDRSTGAVFADPSRRANP